MMAATMQALPIPPKPPAYRHPAKDIAPPQRPRLQGAYIQNAIGNAARVPYSQANSPQFNSQQPSGPFYLPQQVQIAQNLAPSTIIPNGQSTVNNGAASQSPAPQPQPIGIPGTIPVGITHQARTATPVAIAPGPIAIPTTNDPRAIRFVPQPPPRRGGDEAAAQGPLQPWQYQELLYKEKMAAKKPLSGHAPGLIANCSKRSNLPVDTFTQDGWNKVASVLGILDVVEKRGYDFNFVQNAWRLAKEVGGKAAEEGLSPEQRKAVRFWEDLFLKSGHKVIAPSDAFFIVSVINYIKRMRDQEVITGHKVLPGPIHHSIWLQRPQEFVDFARMHTPIGDLAHNPYAHPGYQQPQHIQQHQQYQQHQPQWTQQYTHSNSKFTVPENLLHTFSINEKPQQTQVSPPTLVNPGGHRSSFNHPTLLHPSRLNSISSNPDGPGSTPDKPIELDDDSDSEDTTANQAHTSTEKEQAVERDVGVAVGEDITIVREKISPPAADDDEIQITSHRRVSIDPPSPQMTETPHPSQDEPAENDRLNIMQQLRLGKKVFSWMESPLDLVRLHSGKRPKETKFRKDPNGKKRRHDNGDEHGVEHQDKRRKPVDFRPPPVELNYHPPTPPIHRPPPTPNKIQNMPNIQNMPSLQKKNDDIPPLAEVERRLQEQAAAAAHKLAADFLNGPPSKTAKRPQPTVKGIFAHPSNLPTPPASQSPESSLASPVLSKPPSPVPERTMASPVSSKPVSPLAEPNNTNKFTSDDLFGEDDDDMASLFGEDDDDGELEPEEDTVPQPEAVAESQSQEPAEAHDDEDEELEDILLAAFDEEDEVTGAGDLEKQMMARMDDSGDESSDADDDEVR
ncbi:hypothetical protein BJ508DRAFT_51115 [Ascobolus immersus RN42]|uniref:Uncharacterized protein n=1 Tax=Ascobolus immersus RN42 TaxID=1160509 RepID=A0A3N4IEC6_ASCIM|nr:hypothetical protein BJ508DRAFT_51115 [Ascobolus immersus RN42]